MQIATPLHCLAVQIPVSSVRPSLFFRELVLADTTERTYEILWEILKRCAWLYACLWHSYLWVILPAAYVTYILFHNCCCFNGLLIVMNIPFACHAGRCQGRVMSRGGGVFFCLPCGARQHLCQRGCGGYRARAVTLMCMAGRRAGSRWCVPCGCSRHH